VCVPKSTHSPLLQPMHLHAPHPITPPPIRQLALALRKEVAALEAAGCRIVQVDEPALREGLPLKAGKWDSYLSWAVDAFRCVLFLYSAAGPRLLDCLVLAHLCVVFFAAKL
jgi:hypothetical protein